MCIWRSNVRTSRNLHRTIYISWLWRLTSSSWEVEGQLPASHSWEQSRVRPDSSVQGYVQPDFCSLLSGLAEDEDLTQEPERSGYIWEKKQHTNVTAERVWRADRKTRTLEGKKKGFSLCWTLPLCQQLVCLPALRHGVVFNPSGSVLQKQADPGSAIYKLHHLRPAVLS